jgi:hypothetical protein
MKLGRKTRRRSEDGIALLIAIFVLLLISVVAIALLVSSGTETALGANYRSSSTVYYAALAGLEEVRGRLLPKNPNYFGTSVISPSTTLPVGQTIYLINRLPSENVAPWDSSNQYYDKEYQSEFGVQASSASWQSVNSVWDNNVQGIPGPLFKWVRINAVTEASLYTDINYDGVYDSATPIFFDPAHVDSHGNASPSLVVMTVPPATAKQALEITGLAYSSNGSQKYLQYVVAPVGPDNLSFPAALTLDGPNINPSTPFNLPYGGQFYVDGTDTQFYSSGSGCVAGMNPSPVPVRAIGYSTNDATSNTTITTMIGDNHGEYTGLGFTPSIPSVFYVGPPGPPALAANMQSVVQINNLVAGISQLADVRINGPVTQSDSNNLMPAAMGPTNPMTVVVNGDFTENSWNGTGYGILLVTGNFTYDQNSTWNGIILVIGQGNFIVHDSSGRNGRINGAVFVANTVDASGNPLASLGTPIFNFDNHTAGNYGIYYSNCWVQYVQTAGKYQILSFHEIPQ